MAEIVQEIWSDVNNKLQIDRTGDVKKVVNLEALENAIENILLTRKGERVMRPLFGSSLEYFLLEPLCEATAYKVGLEVLDALKQEERIEVKGVEVIADHRIGGYQVTIEAVVKELNIPFVVQRVLLL
jgi:phage baseplate assembly protein W